MRYNIVHTCLEGSHGNDSSSGRGPWAIEVYNNAFDQVGCTSGCGFGQMQWRSAVLAIFGNTWTSDYGQAINLDNYRSNSDGANFWGGCTGSNAVDGNDEAMVGTKGRHCFDQIGTLYNTVEDGSHQHLPAFIVNNTRGGAYTYAERGNNPSPFTDNPILPNEDFFNGVNASNPNSCATNAPIGDGTCGIGYGTLAQRPATCTGPNGNGTGGVLYWATDQGGDWDTTHGGANDGAVYRCTSTNTWTSYYTPYTYPYPQSSLNAQLKD
jgi:hypothetical protein